MFTAGKHFIEYKHVFLRLEKCTNEFLLKKVTVYSLHRVHCSRCFSTYLECQVSNIEIEEERRKHGMESQSPFVRDISHVTAHQLVRSRACVQGNVVFALLTTQFFQNFQL